MPEDELSHTLQFSFEAIQILLVALISQTTGPTIVALVSEFVFSAAGNWSLAYALSCVIFLGGLACFGAMTFLFRQVRRLPAPASTMD